VLRLHRDNPRAEPSERGYTIADMSADVEDEIAPLDKSPVQAVHGRCTRSVTVVDT
jgi:hypothetical protein